jgi:hypothetical protein
LRTLVASVRASVHRVVSIRRSRASSASAAGVSCSGSMEIRAPVLGNPLFRRPQRFDDQGARRAATPVEQRDEHRVAAMQIQAADATFSVFQRRLEMIDGSRRIGVRGAGHGRQQQRGGEQHAPHGVPDASVAHRNPMVRVV